MLQQRSGRISHDIRLRGADGRYHWLHSEGAPGGQRRRRGRAGDRRALRRHRDQGGRRAHPARRDPRQSDRPAQSRTVLRPARRRRSSQARARRARRRRRRWRSTSITSRTSTTRSACRSAIRRCSRWRAASGASSGQATRWRGSAAISSASSSCSTTSTSRSAANSSNRSAAMLTTPISFGDREVALTVSIGVVAVRSACCTSRRATCFRDAEIALANAKKAGGDRAETFAVSDAGDALRPPVARP